LTSEASADTARWILFDRVEIDLTGRRLFVDGQESPLEPKAFAVLALLARQPGRALTRDEILDAVWGHRHVTPGVLNRIVTLLRRALG
jgi:DNA-binding winged helix-turn-helix (wHTH) protein